jgi:cytosine deaminase
MLMDLVISDARLRGREDPVDIGVANGRIAELAPVNSLRGAREIRADGGLATSSFVEPHCHLDRR